MKTQIAAVFAALITALTATAQTMNVQVSPRVTVTTNLATAQGPNLVNNAGTAGGVNGNYLASVANRHTLLLTGVDTGTGPARAVDQHGRLTAANAIPVSADFMVLSPGLWIRTNDAETTITPSGILAEYEFFRFSNNSWLRWASNGGPPSFTATLNIANESRVVRDAAGTPLANQSHAVPVRAVTYIPVFWFGEANRATLESQLVCLRETITIPSTRNGIVLTETFVRLFTPFDGGENLETGSPRGIEPTEGGLQLITNLLPPVTENTSGPWGWEKSPNLLNWTPVSGSGNVFNMTSPTTLEPRMFFRPAVMQVAGVGARNAPASEPTFVGGADLATGAK